MKPNLVVCSLEPWDEVWRRNQYLVAGLLASSAELKVLFVEPAEDPGHSLRHGLKPELGAGLRRVAGYGDRLWAFQPTKWLPRKAGNGADHLLARSIARAARSLGFHDAALWVNDPALAPLLKAVDWPALYDITDDWLLADRPAAELARLRANERLLFNRCREVVVCSPRLLEVKGAQRPVRLICNAVDVQAYRQQLPRPKDLPDGLVATYVGTLHEDRLDVDRCVATAAEIAGKGTLVLVGPNALTAENTARLTAPDNVAVLGPRPRRDVPAYLQHADVLIVPHVVTPFTDSLDPIKAYEYRASGRPVVATPVAGFRDGEPGVTARSGTDFDRAVAESLLGALPTQPVPDDVVDWSQRVAEMREVLSAL